MTTIVKVFTSPGDAFRRIREKPGWIAPFIIILVFTVGLALINTTKMDPTKWQDVAREQMSKQGMSEDQINERIAQSEKMVNNPVVRYVAPAFSAGVMTVISLLIVALVLLGVVRLCGGTTSNYNLNLALVAYSGLITVPGLILRSVLVFLRGPEHAIIGLSVFMPNLNAGFLYAFLSAIEPFAIWETIVLALGIKVAYDLKNNNCYYLIVGLWLVSIALLSLIPGAGGLGPR